MKKILEARIEFKNNQLERITVLVEISKNDVRAIFATKKPRGGYMHFEPSETVSNELLQDVARFGMQTVDRDDIFPNWEAKYFSEIKG